MNFNLTVNKKQSENTGKFQMGKNTGKSQENLSDNVGTMNYFCQMPSELRFT